MKEVTIYYYVEKDNEIKLFDTDKTRLENTLDFMPELQGLEVKSTTVGNFSIPMEELTAPYIRGVYERVSTAEKTKGQIMAYNAEMRRLPIEMSMTLKYVFSNFNEAIIFVQELFEKILFQRYFQIVYLGQIINCSIEINGGNLIHIHMRHKLRCLKIVRR